MSEQETISAMALTLLSGLPKGLLAQWYMDFGDAETICTQLPEALQAEMPALIKRAHQEWDYVQEKNIRCLGWNDADFPIRLRECEDPPTLLYYKGNANLNAEHVIAMVGTRRCTDYGRDFCQQFLRDLAELCPDVLVVSGLAYGIDVNSHQQALNNHLSTVGVLAHGLDIIYPSSHTAIANVMVDQGGLLTEYMSGSTSESYHFVQRNRIVAGMSDATIVVESKEKGGSLITADLANGYHRDVFAVPGRITDEKSKGCNHLIASQQAVALQSAQDFVEAMQWQHKAKSAVQRKLFVELNEQQSLIVSLLKKHDSLSVNSLAIQCNIPIPQMHGLLLELEMDGVVKALVGNQYRLLD